MARPSPFAALARAQRRADIRFRTEDGCPRCEATTYKGTRCTRMGGIRRVEWANNEWRCYQHGG